MELSKIQFIIWLIRYNAILLFIISFNTANWFEYNSQPYIHYGLWHYCIIGSTQGCQKIPSTNERLYAGAVIPRILMIVAIAFIGVAFAGALFAVQRLYKNTKLVVVMISGIIELFGAIFLACAFIVAFVYGPEVENAGDQRFASLGFSSIFAVFCSLSSFLSSLFSMICFYLQRQKVREDVIVIGDGTAHVETVKLQQVEADTVSMHSRKSGKSTKSGKGSHQRHHHR